MKIYYLSSILFLFFVSISIGQEPGSDNKSNFRAWLEIQKSDSSFTVKGKFVNMTSKTLFLSYRMAVKKSGKSGTSKTNQGGKFKVKSNRETQLSKATFNLNPDDFYLINLRILQNDSLIAQDSVFVDDVNKFEN